MTMRTKMFYAIAIAICGAVGMNSCTKDYDDDLRIQRELIESNESNIKAELAAYQTVIDNTIKQMDIAYKNSDEVIKQEMQAGFDLAKRHLEELSNALNTVKEDLGSLKGNYDEFKETVNLALQVIETEIDAINVKIADQDSKITALDGRLITAEAAIADLKAWKTLAEGQLEELKNSDTENKAAINDLENDVNTINSEISALETNYSNLEAAYKAADMALTGRLDDFQTLVTTMQSTLLENITAYKTELQNAFADHKTAVEGELDALGTQLGTVVSDVATLTGKITTLEGRVGTAEGKITALEAQMATVISHTTDIADLKTNLTAALGKIGALETSLADKEAALKLLIKANEDAAAANKTAIEDLEADIATLNTNLGDQRTELEAAIATAVANKVEQSDIDNAINTLKTELKGEITTVKNDLQGQITAINGRLDALETADTQLGNRLTTLEGKVANIENRIQAIKWVPAFSDGNLTLNATTDTGGAGAAAYTEAKIEEQLYITCNDADIINKIVAGSDYTVEAVFNRVAASRAIEASPFGAVTVEAVSGVNNVLKITMEYTDLSGLFGTYGSGSTPTLTDMQIAIKISNTTTGDMIMSEFAGVMIKNN